MCLTKFAALTDVCSIWRGRCPLCFPGFELRVGQRSGWEQENRQRRHPRREHESWAGQVQDPQTDPLGQHQTAHRRVWVHVMPVRACTHTRRAHGAGLLRLDCRPASLTLFPLHPNKSNVQRDTVAQAQPQMYKYGPEKSPFVTIPNIESRQVTGWKGTYCIFMISFLLMALCSMLAVILS